MKELLEYEISVDERQVDIVHILSGGEVIMNRKELDPFTDRFEWLKPNEVANMVQELKPKTDSSRKSIIAIFETGEIRAYPNVSKNFTDYTLLNKSSI